MNYLLFFITSIFSFIFYVFYKLNNWEDIFWNQLFQTKNFLSLSWNLLIESFLFLLIAFLLFFYFSNNVFSKLFFSKKVEEKLEQEELEDFLWEEEFYEKNYWNQHISKKDQLELNKNSNKKLFNISEENIYLFRIAAFITQYIFIIIWITFLYNNFWNLEKNILNNLFSDFFTINTLIFILYLIIILLLTVSIFINFNIHKKFQNYISLFFSVGVFVFILNFIINIIFSNFLFWYETSTLIKNQLILNMTISFFIIIFTYLYDKKYLFDYSFLHFCAYFVNILWIIYYLYSSEFNIINFLIIIWLNISLWLLSYVKLNKQ